MLSMSKYNANPNPHTSFHPNRHFVKNNYNKQKKAANGPAPYMYISHVYVILCTLPIAYSLSPMTGPPCLFSGMLAGGAWSRVQRRDKGFTAVPLKSALGRRFYMCAYSMTRAISQIPDKPTFGEFFCCVLPKFIKFGILGWWIPGLMGPDGRP